MGTYVEVPAHMIRTTLQAAGFELSKALRTSAGSEEVYDRVHDKDRRYLIRVYTSITSGDSTVRSKGADAIRVVAVFRRDFYVDPGSHFAVGIFKAKRIHRSGSVEAVLERMMQRARDAYAFCNCKMREDIARAADSTRRRQT